MPLLREEVGEDVRVAFNNTDIIAAILARIVECRRVVQLATGQSRVSDVSARILARMSVSVSASWNASFIDLKLCTACVDNFTTVSLATFARGGAAKQCCDQ